MKKTISPGAIVALKEALSQIYWYKADQQTFLYNTVKQPAVLAKVNWNDYKIFISEQEIYCKIPKYIARDTNSNSHCPYLG